MRIVEIECNGPETPGSIRSINPVPVQILSSKPERPGVSCIYFDAGRCRLTRQSGSTCIFDPNNPNFRDPLELQEKEKRQLEDKEKNQEELIRLLLSGIDESALVREKNDAKVLLREAKERLRKRLRLDQEPSTLELVLSYLQRGSTSGLAQETTLATLSEREKEVLQTHIALAGAHKDTQRNNVAKELNIGLSTIKAHLNRINNKLGTKTTIQAVGLYYLHSKAEIEVAPAP